MPRILFTLLGLVLYLIPAPSHAQDHQATQDKVPDPPNWSAWKPYQPPAPADTIIWRWSPERVRRLGLVPPARWLALDPLADDYPSWSPYNFVLGNPLRFVDPDGREVRCQTEENCKRVTEDIQELYSDAPVSYEQRTRTRARFSLFGIEFGGEVTEEYYIVTVDGDSDFDWSQDDYASALYDAIASEDVVFNVFYQETAPIVSRSDNLQEAGGGYFDPLSSREANVYVDPRGNQRVGEPSATILMHEMIGHGHPVATPLPDVDNAHDINRFYHRKLGITLKAGYLNPHRGYKGEIKWPRTGLYRR